jgi:hypothetical protein
MSDHEPAGGQARLYHQAAAQLRQLAEGIDGSRDLALLATLADCDDVERLARQIRDRAGRRLAAVLDGVARRPGDDEAEP